MNPAFLAEIRKHRVDSEEEKEEEVKEAEEEEKVASASDPVLSPDTSPSEVLVGEESNVVPSRIDDDDDDDDDEGEDYFLDTIKSVGGEGALEYGEAFLKKLEERDARWAKQRQEETRAQTNELKQDAGLKAAAMMNHNQQLQSEVMGGIEQNAGTLEELRSDMRTLTEASTEAMRASRNGDVVVKLRDSAIKRKQLEHKNERLENENEELKIKLAVATGNRNADDDASGGGTYLLDAFNAHADVPTSTAAAAGAFTATDEEDCDDGEYGDFAFSSTDGDAKCEDNNGSGDVLNRAKAAEDASVRRQKAARQDRDVAEYQKKTLPGAPTTFPNVSSKIDTGSAVSATTKKTDSSKTTTIPASNQKKASLRPPLCPPSTKKPSDSGDGTSFSTPARRGGNRGVGSSAGGRSTRSTRSTRSAAKRAAATGGESPSEGPQPKRARRSPRSASTK